MRGYASPGTNYFEDSRVLYDECDILVPAFLEKAIRMSNIDKFKCKIILEAATAACSFDADKNL